MRNITIAFDGLARVDGSARFSFGTTGALASISGPIEVRPQSELPSQAFFEVHVRPLSHVPSTESKAQAQIIRAALTPSISLSQNPRTLVQLTIQSLSASGGIQGAGRYGLLAAMVNASSLALLNAGSITMKGVVTAIAVGLRKDGTFSVDPELAEEKGLSGIGCFAFLFAHGLRDDNEDCVLTQWQGRADESQIVEARKVAQVAAQDVLRRFKASLGPQALLDEEKNESMSDHDEEVDDDKMEI